MTHVAVPETKNLLTDLVRRAEAGEAVVLTRDGKPVARIEALQPAKTAEERDRVIQRAHAALQGVLFDETCAARSQDWLYDEDGLPA